MAFRRAGAWGNLVSPCSSKRMATVTVAMRIHSTGDAPVQGLAIDEEGGRQGKKWKRGG